MNTSKLTDKAQEAIVAAQRLGAADRGGMERRFALDQVDVVSEPVLNGDRAQLPTEQDWPPVTATDEETWEQTKLMLKQGHQELRSAIAGLDDSWLDQPIIEGMSSVYVQLHGVIQHDLYHAGQIALLKKTVSEGSDE